MRERLFKFSEVEGDARRAAQGVQCAFDALGLQAYGTARGACALLSAMSLNEAAQARHAPRPEDVLRSRKTTLGVEELEEFEPLLNLKAGAVDVSLASLRSGKEDFDNFGLGVQLVPWRACDFVMDLR